MYFDCNTFWGWGNDAAHNQKVMKWEAEKPGPTNTEKQMCPVTGTTTQNLRVNQSFKPWLQSYSKGITLALVTIAEN